MSMDAGPSTYATSTMVSEIRRTAKAAHARGLINATKWALDLLRGISPVIRAQQSPTPEPEIPEDEQLESETLHLARLAIDEKQYSRAIVLLDDADSAKGVFLRIYCNYIVSEKRALREWHSLDGKRQQPPKPVNTQIAELFLMVEDAEDPWLLFLKALFLFRLSRLNDAIDCILPAIAAIPWNWSAWQLLVDCVHDPKELDTVLARIPLPTSHPMVQIFIIRMMNVLNAFDVDDVYHCQSLLDASMFPDFLWLRAQFALGYFNMHMWERAESEFDHVLSTDPYRCDDIEILADTLYAVENKEKLASLAQFYLVLNKHRPETCYLLGCHYSLRAEHEKSAKYFRRATQLDSTFSAAWTMMGLEFVEMENPQAAIESFRRAVGKSYIYANPRDYRAWSGMGKAYGTLAMPNYALHYLTRALHLRPDEAEPWEDLGQAWEQLGKADMAISCLKKALESEAPHPLQVYIRLMQLLISVDELNSAVYYAEQAVATGHTLNAPVASYAKALIAVAEHQAHSPAGDWGRARDYLDRVLSRPGSAGDEAAQKKAADLMSLVRTKLMMRGNV
ncbi:TPR-REGION domain-containing protein [Mycena chlorophos]|uniref:TPR-REGION domain-containing protein n=1 Tax=Mycena chlorophos TaxID=658473 RepID=A0A8H6SP94_MYCCL|nr:TPR-REGION domain-containing protein [Mycena chlorophos]